MSDYSRGKIYKLFIRGLEEVCYIGSTTNTLSERLCMHRHQAKTPSQNQSASSCLFEEENEVVIELLESFPCESKRDLEERERVWIEKFPDCVNKNIPARSWRERWYAKHEHNLAKHREWLAANKKKIARKRKEERLANLDEARAKEREARNKRKKVANSQKKEKVKCDVCDKMMNRNSLWLHKKSVHSES